MQKLSRDAVSNAKITSVGQENWRLQKQLHEVGRKARKTNNKTIPWVKLDRNTFVGKKSLQLIGNYFIKLQYSYYSAAEAANG